MLSCSCDYDYESASWYYNEPEDFSTVPGKRTVCCQSCGKKINVGATCLAFSRFRYDDNGNEILLADRYLCESCGEIHLNLEAIGYCCNLGKDLREDMADYQEMTGFDPAKYAQEVKNA